MTGADRACRVVWAPSVPAEVRAAAAPTVADYLPLVPPWVRWLHVEWDDADAKSGANVRSLPENRRAWITLCPGWLSEPDRRESYLRHELVHLPLEPLHDFVGTLLNRLARDDHPALYAWAKEAWRVALEGAVTDLAEGMHAWREADRDARAAEDLVL